MSRRVGRVVVRGTSLWFSAAGSSPKVVLCIPGALGTAESDFGPQLDKLSEHFTVVSFDPRGYGRSRPPTRTFSSNFYHEDAEDAAAIMEKLQFDKYSVLGWSDGANAAIILSSKFPSKVENLVVWGGNAFITPDDIERIEKTRNIDNWSDRMRESLFSVYGEELQPLWNSFCDSMKEIYNTDDHNVCIKETEQIQAPTFLLHGKLDPMVSPEHLSYFKKHIPQLKKVHIYEEGKHNIHLRFASHFNGLVTDFIMNKDASL